MKEFGEALSLIFEKIAALFDIFDLSFFISGAISLAAVAFALVHSGAGLPETDSWIMVFGILIASYVGGLVCFASGRWLRKEFPIPKKVDFVVRDLPDLLVAHGIAVAPGIDGYVGRKEYCAALYTRFWAELRQSKDCTESLNFLNKYWVRTATYDGVAFALILWIPVVIFGMFRVGPSSPLNLWFGIFVSVALVGFAWMCIHEANRYTKYQLDELVAAMATHFPNGLLKRPHGG
jgi:hypothetical protein